jgi:DNA-binding NtrC family response regulator
MTPGRLLQPSPLPRDLEAGRPRLRLGRGRRLKDLVAELERSTILATLKKLGDNQSHAARELGLTEQSLRYRLRKYEGPAARQKRRIR